MASSGLLFAQAICRPYGNPSLADRQLRDRGLVTNALGTWEWVLGRVAQSCKSVSRVAGNQFVCLSSLQLYGFSSLTQLNQACIVCAQATPLRYLSKNSAFIQLHGVKSADVLRVLAQLCFRSFYAVKVKIFLASEIH